MSFIDTTSADAAEGEIAAMYRRQQSFWGYVPNYAKVFCHRPELMARWGQLLAEIRRPMDLRRYELVTFAAAHELGSSACSLAHGKALGAFFSDAEIVAMAEGRDDAVLGAAEQAVLRFARQVAREASHVSAQQVEALAAHGYDDAEVFDIAAAAAGRAFFAKLLDALGVQADAPFLALGGSLRDALTVGRPIDVLAPVTMPLAEPTPAANPADRHVA